MAGFSLVEVLVSVVVLSFGLLGMVGMQLAAMQSSREARLQSLAASLASELAEMAAANNEVNNKPTKADNPYIFSFAESAPKTPTTDCFKTTCVSAKDMATWQVAEWSARVSDPVRGLPEARVEACFDAAAYDASGIPRWACTPGNGPLVVKIGWTRRSTRSTSADKDNAFQLAAGDDAAPPYVVMPIASGAGS